MKKLLIGLLLYVVLPSHASNIELYNFTNATTVVRSQHTEVVSIASITKLFTASLILTEHLDLNEKVKVQGKSTGRFPNGAMVTRIELMKAMLIASDNRSADTLAHTYPGGYQKFIIDVNDMVGAMGLRNTKIEDASGLKSGNVSTAEDLVNFVWSLRNQPLIISLSSSPNEKLQYENKKKHIELPIKNTNPDIVKYNNILISKTGFTNAAGRCLVMLVTYENDVYGLAILGEKTPKTRSKIVNDLMNSM